ncbi:MAG: HipA family kinase [Rhodospirillales bacterium]
MPLNAIRPLRKMRGGAQSHLVEADDGHFYVVKFRNNPQHRRVLINEAIGSVLLRYLQISAPEVFVVSASVEFLRNNPEVSIQLGSRSIPADAGWHFGSRYPGHPDTVAVYDFIPDALLRQVVNLREFLGVLVFDKWTGNADGRQAVFFRSRLNQWSPAGAVARTGFVAWMIDQGFLFNGPHWDFPDAPLQGLYHRPLVYEAVTSLDDFQPWLDLVVNFPVEVIDEAYRKIPLEWLEGEENALEELLEKLLRRRSRVPDLLEDCRRARPGLFPNWN